MRLEHSVFREAILFVAESSHVRPDPSVEKDNMTKQPMDRKEVV